MRSNNDKTLVADLRNAIGLSAALQARDKDARTIFDRAGRAAASLQRFTEAHVDAAAAHRKTMRAVHKTASALHGATRQRLLAFHAALYTRTHDEAGTLLEEDRWLDGSWFITTYAPSGGVGRLARGGPKLQEQVRDICTGMVKALGDERFIEPLRPLLAEHAAARQAMAASARMLSQVRENLKSARAEAGTVCGGIRHYLSYKEIVGDPDAVSPAMALPGQTAEWKKKREARKEKVEREKEARRKAQQPGSPPDPADPTDRGA